MADKPEREIDEDLVHQLARLLEKTGLTEIEYGRDDWHIRVRGGFTQVSSTAEVTQLPSAPPSPEAVVDVVNAVTSPMVGIVFTSSEPEAPPFVKVGDQVTEGQTLLLIEAMKVFNPITAPRAGKITQVLITNGAPVEFGEPLLVLE
ncbi:MAG: acetyl-CoA carboxylase biotin carboxyl carrier protein subunit [Proteobacteria bacterium]|nr:acetyl-CoA carboxylase biotin carboxyl carrier protein subunit [Pseudomonadota bacterium]